MDNDSISFSPQPDTGAEFITALISEVDYFAQEIRKNDIQPLRRAYCLSVLQFIDGTSAQLKNTVSEYETPESLDEDLYLALSDKTKRISIDGKEKISRSYKGFAENLFFAVDTFGWTSGIEINLKKEHKDWKRFIDCIRVRNRVVHPKSEEDLFISDSDLLEMVTMFEWLKEVLISLHHSVAESSILQIEAMCTSWLKTHSDSGGSIRKWLDETSVLKKLLGYLKYTPKRNQ